ncbi:response regulator [Microvirga sp. KLBC 81]|uniref:response regulator transcription factor n=1 Tax=Microvirga sp. KLBC 81 TaxID=1862707 RepID=UPI000D5091CE|nr:response regulator [Microvirga sp. KLBC 81]PVE23755.1 response regulator [Microvirga sp. KLBC 81]
MSEHTNVVLVVDDDAAVRESLRFALELEGLDVRVYESSTDLLTEPTLPECGCLVVDYNMPGMNGVELVAKLREHHCNYPVILVTSGAAHDVLDCALRSGIRDVLEKPLLGNTLTDCIYATLFGAACAWPRSCEFPKE